MHDATNERCFKFHIFQTQLFPVFHLLIVLLAARLNAVLLFPLFRLLSFWNARVSVVF